MSVADSSNPREQTDRSQKAVDPTQRQSLPGEASADRTIAGEDQPIPGSRDDSTIAGRYRILRLHARGGLGEVFVAEDMELGRQVALKEIQPQADRESNRARFVLEAEITGGLEHPGIVPVYGLGQYADGRPYYAMRFIAGESMRDAIRRFHRASEHAAQASDGKNAYLHALRAHEFNSLEFRQLLQRFVAVCQAVAFAHARGVLHRDLKPDNVMLGKYGETLVVDWGLAKSTGQTDLAAEGEVALQPRSGTDSAETIVGQTLGTPAYMSPEQAAGNLEELGPPADIYSLGATLFELLTGRVAFQGKYAQIILEDIAAARFPKPRDVVKEVPRELEAICLKAMAHRPVDRFSTAQELAADIEHWLADEPVSAYAEPLSARLWRWTRRHRTLVSSAAVLLVMAAIGTTAGIVLVSREQGRTAHERDEKELARQQAVENEKQALAARNAEAAARKRTREALNTLTDDVIEKLLAKQVQLGDNEKRFLQRVQRFYEELSASGGPGADAPSNQLDGLFRLANIHSRLGQSRQAEKAYREALALSTHLIAELPAKPEFRENLARIRTNLANLLSELGQRAEAETHYRAAIPIQTQLAFDHPASPEYRESLARSYSNLGVLLRDMNRLAETETAYKDSLAIRTKLVADHPTVAEYRQDAARIRTNLGALYTELNRREEAMAQYRSALEDQTKLAEEFPNVPAYRQALGATNNNLGNLLTDLKRLDEAESAYRAALTVKKKLAADFPSMPEYRRDLAVSQTNFAILLRDLRKADEAEAALKEAIGVRSRLSSDYPENRSYRQELARSHSSLGALLRDLKRTADADASFRAALELRAKLAAEAPSDAEAAIDAARTNINLALMRRAELNIPEYRRLLEAALPFLKSALETAPKNKAYRELHHFALNNLATAQLVQSDHVAAAKSARELVRLNLKPGADRIAAAGILGHCVVFTQNDQSLAESRRAEIAADYSRQSLNWLLEAARTDSLAVLTAIKTSDFDAIRPRPEFHEFLWTLADAPVPPAK